MAINFNKHRNSLQTAWKDVLDDKTDTDWALFGYDGQSNDLALVGKGDGGLEELAEDLNSGKIMYAFVKVNDPKTSLHKFVLINWQGEGANTVRKGICANHLLDVERFFTGHHLTVSARNEEEVEPDLIIEKVAKSGSAYSFKAPRGDISGPTNAIGTNYKRVNPVKEINSKERDQFWQKEEQEERKRVEEERQKREIQRLKHEEDLKKRDLFEAAQREAKTEEHNTRIDQIKEAQHQANVVEKKQHEDATYVQEEATKVNQSDVLRQQRNMETQELISRRTIDARSVFEKNTSAGQIKCAPEKPVRHSLLKQQQQIQFEQQQQQFELQQQQQKQTVVNKPEVAEEPQQSDDEPDQFSTIKRSPKDIDKKTEVIQPDTIKNNISSHQEIEHKENIYNNSLHITEQQFVDEVIYQEFADGPGLQARALYDYQAADDTEITFDPGDIITNIDQVDEGWWQGLGPDGTYGLFPANYVELME